MIDTLKVLKYMVFSNSMVILLMPYYLWKHGISSYLPQLEVLLNENSGTKP